MRYLFDENSSPTDKFLETHPECENVKYKDGQGVKDETILARSNNKEHIIVTKDIEFALMHLLLIFM